MTTHPFLPHPSATFEGYYTRFDLSSGSTVVAIYCTVPHGPARPHMVSFTYIPSNTAWPMYQCELWPRSLDLTQHNPTSFSLTSPSNGSMTAHDMQRTSYTLHSSSTDLSFTATCTTRLPWSWRRCASTSLLNTPAYWLAFLPLPLHWHVQSLASATSYTLRLPEGIAMPEEVLHGEATAHMEKNWASSFPTAHLWVQACTGTRAICLAGGKTLGVEAYLLGYRNEQAALEIDMRPPFAVAWWRGWGPWMSVRRDWEGKSVHLVVKDWRWKVDVSVSVPGRSDGGGSDGEGEGQSSSSSSSSPKHCNFFTLSAPWPTGHRANAMAQSVRGVVSVVVSRRRWGILGPWDEVVRDHFEHAGVEFGGEFYPLAGSLQRWH